MLENGIQVSNEEPMANKKSLSIFGLTASLLIATALPGQKLFAESRKERYFTNHWQLGLVLGTCTEMVGTLNRREARKFVDAYWRGMFFRMGDIDGTAMYDAAKMVGYPPPGKMRQGVYDYIEKQGGCEAIFSRYGYQEFMP